MSDNHQNTLLNYRIFSPKNENFQDKTPLFILHGLLGSMDNWRSQASKLSSNRTVITMDLRNHGSSPHLRGMSYRDMYEDVIKVAEHLNITQFNLLGHSMGGKVAMQLALSQNERQNGTQTDLVNSLIVVDIAPRPYPLWHQDTLQAIMTAPVETMESRQEVDEHLKASIEDLTERTFLIKNLRRANPTDDNGSSTGFRWKCNLEEISRGYLKIAGFTTAHKQYLKDTLFISGGHSPYIQEQDSPIISALFPNSSIITMEKSGHLPHLEQSDDFFHHVDSFLSPLE